MDDNDGCITVFLFWVLVLAVFFLGSATGIDKGRQSAFVDYCEYQGGKYEQIDDVDYCIVDNQSQVIEWAE